jgi:hypothetical protein
MDKETESQRIVGQQRPCVVMGEHTLSILREQCRGTGTPGAAARCGGTAALTPLSESSHKFANVKRKYIT